jgi:hypothetical protein
MREIGESKFEIHLLEEILNTTKKELLIKEFEYITRYHPNALYNTLLTLMDHGFDGRTHSEEVKVKLSQAQNKGGSVSVRGNLFGYEWYERQEDGSRKKLYQSFSFGPKSPWDREEAYYHLQQFKNTKFPPQVSMRR